MIKCPICKGQTNRYMKIQSHKINLFATNGFIEYLQCKTCTFIFNSKNQDLSPDEIRNYYQGELDYNKLKFRVLCDLGSYYKTASNYISFINGHVSDIGKMKKIDVGGGAGEFCYIANEKYGWMFDLYDYSIKRVEIAQEVFKIQNVFIQRSQLKKMYEICTLFNVIEHTANPIEYLSHLINSLKNPDMDFHLFIATPDTKSVGARLFRRNWIHYRDHHISLFNRQSLKILFELMNFTVVEIRNAYMYTTGHKNIPKEIITHMLKRSHKRSFSSDGLISYAIVR